jgi:hypothetical protein
MVLTLALLLAGSAPPPTPNPPTASPPGENSGPMINVTGSRRKWEPQRVVCKELTEPGSRLSVKRICRSMLEWASDKRENQQALIEKQYNGAK